MFKIWFGATFYAYQQEFDKLVLINTDPSDTKKPLEKSYTFTTPLVSVNYNSINAKGGNKNWLTMGEGVLNHLLANNVNV